MCILKTFLVLNGSVGVYFPSNLSIIYSYLALGGPIKKQNVKHVGSLKNHNPFLGFLEGND